MYVRSRPNSIRCSFNDAVSLAVFLTLSLSLGCDEAGQRIEANQKSSLHEINRNHQDDVSNMCRCPQAASRRQAKSFTSSEAAVQPKRQKVVRLPALRLPFRTDAGHSGGASTPSLAVNSE